ncbi:MAG: response regulator, partial [Acidimicrobiales bacterium]
DKFAENDVDMVLLDVMMPRMDGYEVCEKLRAGGCTAPIVMVSALSSPADVARGEAAGATAYVEKVASKDNLLTLVARMLAG